MSTITISKREYKELVDKKMRYERLVDAVKEDLFAPPPVRSRKAVLKAFKETGKYSPAFLKSLRHGLGRSSYFRA